MEGIVEVPSDWWWRSDEESAFHSQNFNLARSDARNPLLDYNNANWLEPPAGLPLEGLVNAGSAAPQFNLSSQFQESSSSDYPYTFSESSYLRFESLSPSPPPAFRLPPWSPASTLTLGELSPQSSQTSSGRSLSPLEISRDPKRQVSLPR